MTAIERVDHTFVEFIPDELTPNTIYVSMEYGTAVHACLCGCGNRVITPFTPNDWQLTYDGETISLHPSVGNWSFPCQSHYIIRESRIIWAEQWSQERIDAGRAWDKRRKEGHHADSDDRPATPISSAVTTADEADTAWSLHGFADALRRRLRRRN